MPATPAWPPKSAPRLFGQDELAAGAVVRIEGNPAHYLARVMRAQPGDSVILCDDVTGEWAARVAQVGKRDVVLEVAAMLRPREAVPDLWLCPALLKKDRFDLVLEKATDWRAGDHPLVPRCLPDNSLEASGDAPRAANMPRTAFPTGEPVSLDACWGWPQTRTVFRREQRRRPRVRFAAPPPAHPPRRAASTMAEPAIRRPRAPHHARRHLAGRDSRRRRTRCMDGRRGRLVSPAAHLRPATQFALASANANLPSHRQTGFLRQPAKEGPMP